jgi:hypothetical protein
VAYSYRASWGYHRHTDHHEVIFTSYQLELSSIHRSSWNVVCISCQLELSCRHI